MSRRLVFALCLFAFALSVACGSSARRTPTPTPALPPVELEGRGDAVVDVGRFTGEAYTKAEIECDCKGHFLVVPYDGDDTRLVSLVNEIGAYSGVVKWDDRAASLEIKADGAWTIKISR